MLYLVDLVPRGFALTLPVLLWREASLGPPSTTGWRTRVMEFKMLPVRQWKFGRHSAVGFPGGSAGKESACNVRRSEFDPWVRKIPWRRDWPPTPVFLPRESHGQRRLVGYSPWGGKDSRITECVRAGQGLLVPLVCTDGLSSPTWGGDGPSAWATLLPSLLQAGQGSCCSLWCSHPHLCGAAPFLGLWQRPWHFRMFILFFLSLLFGSSELQGSPVPSWKIYRRLKKKKENSGSSPRWCS